MEVRRERVNRRGNSLLARLSSVFTPAFTPAGAWRGRHLLVVWFDVLELDGDDLVRPRASNRYKHDGTVTVSQLHASRCRIAASAAGCRYRCVAAMHRCRYCVAAMHRCRYCVAAMHRRVSLQVRRRAPLHERLALLATAFTPIEAYVQVVASTHVCRVCASR